MHRPFQFRKPLENLRQPWLHSHHILSGNLGLCWRHSPALAALWLFWGCLGLCEDVMAQVGRTRGAGSTSHRHPHGTQSWAWPTEIRHSCTPRSRQIPAFLPLVSGNKTKSWHFNSYLVYTIWTYQNALLCYKNNNANLASTSGKTESDDQDQGGPSPWGALCFSWDPAPTEHGIFWKNGHTPPLCVYVCMYLLYSCPTHFSC